ncbi:tyrosine--tRNA ligase [Lentilactobacillus hilgardii]|uniref:Tyrosine--tRNA ligase n=1 Tax=Lentilactobacillus hilgardii (strain ATCC 8290 / DSM 20176 / CCUG 30140 / JCM 1155 / KCTC 3500 / NBRC 15886 / NCIMB 8040 / NRRL B-1843 / 9) TaxID=1423757 RepID=C0XNH6_LENH9|nr:tyrosine--tRNA ligase [Lentilactobacillus hilgardii]EEI20055.1 tyrosine--tRNA ligase [Lentilactobacillus buchneri ATCC 11577]EEI23102.1 tyrosine--tRNA ligase [Lentilactobacillus hilgardii DSM 20176 = ATCC 8290]KRK54018.1 tyrosine--tRNA ligase [Lentilactobacillus hilgardii DSM 20176 = ATCC 8290]MCP9334058.1 tyrosine--tRNA ligase [Lentilactobacillus hilgardii]MCP9350679.1 tyrosine--tRNA ligase [Lentilactobacillus hilgardii]
MNILDDLKWRGAINQETDHDGLYDLVNKKSVGLYVGIDPTGDSMHIGHLIPFMILKRFQLAGHHPVILIGGGTGSIGDPSGKKSERVLQTMDQVHHNQEALTHQMEKLFGQDGSFEIVNNYDWLSKMSLLDFLRDYGKLFNINTMIRKEIIASRLEAGISFTEFTYQILQGVDFLHLFRYNDVQVQLGGADQWGNITSGIDLIHKVEGSDAQAYGMTIPLLLKADGTKFGKSEGGNVWLDPEKTTPYEFYQFWLNQDDRDVVKYLKYFTFLDKTEIDDLEKKVQTHPEKREAQRRLAQEVTKFVHGPKAVESAERISKALFSGEVADLTTTEIEQGFKNMPTVNVSSEPLNIVQWLVDATKIESSRRQAREDINNGAIRINGAKIQDTDFEINPSDKFDGKFVIVRRGKKRYFLARVK